MITEQSEDSSYDIIPASGDKQGLAERQEGDINE
jgi:hypothetical protein